MPASTSLSDYLSTTAHELLQDLDRIKQHIENILAFFLSFNTTDSKKPYFPYEVSAATDPWETKETPSWSTELMIAHALSSVCGGHEKKKPLLAPASLSIIRRSKPSDDLVINVHKESEQLVARLFTSDQPAGIISETFGNNSPFITCWYTELALLHDKKVPSPLLDKLRHVLDVYKPNTLQSRGSDCGTVEGYDSWKGVDPSRAFFALRLLQSNLLLGEYCHSPDKKLQSENVSAFAEYFLSRLHDHLSFFRIPDSRFDPAELAFNLEGALTCESQNGPKLERATLKVALGVLAECQTHTSQWRPVRPIKRDNRGQVLFPVNVEVANSITRSVRLAASQPPAVDITSTIDALRAYMNWLDTRAVTVVRGGITMSGWHSEHINNERVIHPWETSQVLTFLLHLGGLICDQLEESSLRIAGFNTTPYASLESDKTIPACEYGDEFNAREQIQQRFLNQPPTAAKNVSLLLYGPPGTGKTTIARVIAQKLGLKLISISVSDFLASGGADIERQAKDVFKVLRHQRKAMVLFDEIDHLLLDRNSKRYGELDTVFQFLTPGMLTKLQSLHDDQIYFAIATNYEYRIDPAIKRSGRIDHAQLVLPPSFAERKDIIKSCVPRGSEDAGSSGDKIYDEQCNQLAIESWGLVRQSITTALKDCLVHGARVEMLKRQQRACSIGNYTDSEYQNSIHTLKEVIGVVAIEVEEKSDEQVAELISLTKKNGAVGRLLKEMKSECDSICNQFSDEDLKEKVTRFCAEVPA